MRLDYGHDGSARRSKLLVKNFRREWFRACVKIGVGEKTGPEWYQYNGLTTDDFRRSAVRSLTTDGANHATATKTAGHPTLSVLQRYNNVSTEQLCAAITKASNNARTMQSAVRRSRK